jgi:NADH-quinone oxidoreductase subunit N
MAAGNLGALVQTNFKRLLAYSGVAHAGTLLLLVAAQRASGELSYDATSAALFYMAAYVATAGGAFGLLAWLEADGDHFTQIESLKGLGRRRPAMAAAMTLFLLSLGGIPATGGFLAKWMVFSVTLDAHLTGYAIAGVLMSVIALAYYLRVIVAMYMEPASDQVAPPTAKRTDAMLATAICAATVLMMGVLPSVFLGLI